MTAAQTDPLWVCEEQMYLESLCMKYIPSQQVRPLALVLDSIVLLSIKPTRWKTLDTNTRLSIRPLGHC